MVRSRARLRRAFLGGVWHPQPDSGEQVDLQDVDRVEIDVAHGEGSAQDREIVEQVTSGDLADLHQRERMFLGHIVEDGVSLGSTRFVT